LCPRDNDTDRNSGVSSLDVEVKTYQRVESIDYENELQRQNFPVDFQPISDTFQFIFNVIV